MARTLVIGLCCLFPLAVRGRGAGDAAWDAEAKAALERIIEYSVSWERRGETGELAPSLEALDADIATVTRAYEEDRDGAAAVVAVAAEVLQESPYVDVAGHGQGSLRDELRVRGERLGALLGGQDAR